MNWSPFPDVPCLRLFRPDSLSTPAAKSRHEPVNQPERHHQPYYSKHAPRRDVCVQLEKESLLFLALLLLVQQRGVCFYRQLGQIGAKVHAEYPVVAWPDCAAADGTLGFP